MYRTIRRYTLESLVDSIGIPAPGSQMTIVVEQLPCFTEEAHMIVLACGPTKMGSSTGPYVIWRMVQLHSVDQISYETIRQMLKK